MKVKYNGYILDVEEIRDSEDNFAHYRAICDKLPYFPNGIFKTDLTRIIHDFIRNVNSTLDKKSSTLTLNYHYFSSKVYWDNTNCWWYVSHIMDKADKDILKDDAIIGRHTQELQGKFEDYIDKYLVERNK